MNTYDLINNPDSLLAEVDITQENLIIADQKSLESLGTHFHLAIKEVMDYNDDYPVFFIPGAGYDLFTFIFFNEAKKGSFFEKVSLVLMKHNLVILMDQQSSYQKFIEEAKNENTFETIVSAYFYFMEFSFSEMFTNLCRYEEHLNHIEAQLMIGSKDFRVKDIIHEKNICLQIKKYARLLFCSGEDLKLNLNSLIPESESRLLVNISAKINLLNEMSNHLFEICTHLLEVYDSTVNTKTNNSINKLTVFNFFATPITLISGIYGMNFINMPGLSHPYGYYIVLLVMLSVTFIIYRVLKKIKLL